MREAAVNSDPFQQANVAVLLLILLVATVSLPALCGYAVTMLIRGRRRPGGFLRGLAAMAAAATVAAYTWGALHLVHDESQVSAACQQAVGPDQVRDLTSYGASYLPLGFTCRVDGGSAYEIFVPGYVNPTVLALFLVTLVLVALARRAGRATPVPSTTGGIT